MKRRAALYIAFILYTVSLILAGCGPDKFETNCIDRGGSVTTHRSAHVTTRYCIKDGKQIGVSNSTR